MSGLVTRSALIKKSQSPRIGSIAYENTTHDMASTVTTRSIGSWAMPTGAARTMPHRATKPHPVPCRRFSSLCAPSSSSRSCGARAASNETAPDTLPSTYLRTVVPSALAMMLGNVDRICLSVAILPLAAEMGWAEGAQGIVQSAFLWGYVSTQLIGGTLADRFGGKRVMAAGMLFFSVASMLLPLVAITPLTESLGVVFPAVLLSRFLVGLVRVGPDSGIRRVLWSAPPSIDMALDLASRPGGMRLLALSSRRSQPVTHPRTHARTHILTLVAQTGSVSSSGGGSRPAERE